MQDSDLSSEPEINCAMLNKLRGATDRLEEGRGGGDSHSEPKCKIPTLTDIKYAFEFLFVCFALYCEFFFCIIIIFFF